ncbi:adhesion G protein-coupled receptor L3-like [Daphnia pulex]|uniref:adhesion G protein-coupled receptor L3-like n=1 Tax=Daphnia pulex TaxID=6669 RepID=UPI001EDFF1B1|nr:adhesion G protein-coupled receptor L3-like [Daphnia pulex]
MNSCLKLIVFLYWARIISCQVSTSNFKYKQLLVCPAKCVSGYSPDYCWPEAQADSKSSENCPPGFIGTATWTCGIDGQWTTLTPDLSNCVNPIVGNSINHANANITDGENPSESLNFLTKVLNENELESGNIAQLDQTIRLAFDKQTVLMTANSDSNSRDSSSKVFAKSVIDLYDIMFVNAKAFWGLPWILRSEAVDRVQKNVDDTLFLLAENLIDGIYQNYGPNVNLLVQVENRPKLYYYDKSYTYAAGGNDRMTLPAGFSSAVNDNNTLLYCSTFPAFQNILYGDALTQLMLESKPVRQVLVSKVVGASLGQPNGSSIHLADDQAEILLSTLNLDVYDVDEKSVRCAYWNVSTQDWSFDGCVVATNNKSATVCRCDHLTNFAVLMDINGVFQNQTTSALDYITIIGESISIVCLTLSLIPFYWVRTLRRDFRFVVHRNLCLNLLIAEILLLAGIDATANRDLCLSIAVFLHLFFLCAFSWMFIEGLYMYIIITKVFNDKGLKRRIYYIIGYGVPVLTVTITLAVTKTEAYLGDPFSYCWLSYENGAIWAFAGPVAAVVLMNLVFLILVLCVTFKSIRSTIGKKENKQNLRWIMGSISLTFILGITWVFGFLYFGQGTMIFAYVFTILNSLQGLFIFITLCVMNKKVRKDLVRQFVTSQRLQRVAHRFNIELSDMNTNISTAVRTET